MSDANTSQPVRTENNGDIVVKLVDFTTPTQGLGIDASGRPTVKLDDGAGNAITSQANGAQRALDVGINVAGVQVDPRAIRALTSSDVVTAAQGAPNTAANGWPIKITDGTSVQAVKAASTAAAAADPASVVSLSPNSPVPAGTNQIGTVLSKLEDGAGNAITSQVNGSQRALDVGINVAGVQVDPRAIRALTSSDVVSANIRDNTGAAFSTTNPLPVTVVSETLGTEVNKYNTSVALAAAASVNHDYTITSLKIFKGRKFWASGSGKIKAEVQISPDGTTFTTNWVGFNSTSNPNISIDLDLLTISDSGTGSKIRIIITNRDNQSQDVYSTISGSEY